MEFVMGIVKTQLSPFNWKTILILVAAVGALFFAFRLFAKFNTDPSASATADTVTDANASAVVEEKQPQQHEQQTQEEVQYPDEGQAATTE